MGNFFTKNRSLEHIENLESRLRSLESLDTNQDGTISRTELEHWKKAQESLLSSFKDEIVYQNNQQHQLEIAELKKEIKSLKSINRQLELKNRPSIKSSQNTDSQNTDSQNVFVPGISKEKIHQLAEKWIKNEAININYFPDAIEQQLYKNIINIILGILEETLESSQIKFLGHVLDSPNLGRYEPNPNTRQNPMGV